MFDTPIFAVRENTNNETVKIVAIWDGYEIGVNPKTSAVFMYKDDYIQHQTETPQWHDLITVKSPLSPILEMWESLPSYMRDAIVAMWGKKISAIKTLRGYYHEQGKEAYKSLAICKEIVEYGQDNFTPAAWKR